MGKNAWDVVKKGLSTFAPLLGSALGPVGGVAGAMVSAVLGVDNEPESITKGLENASPETIAELKRIELENKTELTKLGLQVQIAEAEADAKSIGHVNATMQVETKSEDAWTRRWRPFWGYSSAIAFFIVCMALGWALVIEGNDVVIKNLGSIVTSIAMLFSIPGAILGVSAWHRGVKQRIEAGQQNKGANVFADALAKRIGGK